MASKGATYIYVIRGPGGFKVGYSVRPEARLSALQSGTTEKLSLVHEVRYLSATDAKADEGKVHTLLAPWKVRGEWFDCRIEIVKIAIEAAQLACPRRTEFLRLRAADSADARKRLEAEFGDLQYIAHGLDTGWLKGLTGERKRGCNRASRKVSRMPLISLAFVP